MNQIAHIKLLILALASVSLFSAQADSVEFIRKNLGLEITNLSFGSPLTNYPGAVKVWTGKTSWQLQTEFDWYETDASTAYHREHPLRRLRYGFKEDRLAAIEIFIGFVDFGADKEKRAAFKASLDAIYAEFKKLRGKGPALEDVNLRVFYDGLCNPGEHIAARVTILPPQKNSARP